jgi:hypothetical protein
MVSTIHHNHVVAAVKIAFTAATTLVPSVITDTSPFIAGNGIDRLDAALGGNDGGTLVVSLHPQTSEAAEAAPVQKASSVGPTKADNCASRQLYSSSLYVKA